MIETMTVQKIVDLLIPNQQSADRILDNAVSKITEYEAIGVDIDLTRAVNLASSKDDELTMDLKRSISKAITNKSLSVYTQIGNCLDDWEIKIDDKFSNWIKSLQIDTGISIPPIFITEGNKKTPRKRTKLEMRHAAVIEAIDILKKEDPLFDPLRLDRGMKREIFNRCQIKHPSLFAITEGSFHSEYWNSDLRRQVLRVKNEEKFKS